jgi:hypothetical protein
MLNMKKHKYFDTSDNQEAALARGRVGNEIGICMCKFIAYASRQAQVTRWTRLVTSTVGNELKKVPTRDQLRTCIPLARSIAEGREVVTVDDVGGHQEEGYTMDKRSGGAKTSGEVEVVEANDRVIHVKDLVGGVYRGGKRVNPVLRSTTENRTRGGTPRGSTTRARGRGGTPRGGAQGSQSRRTSIGVEDSKPRQKEGRKSRTPGTFLIDRRIISAYVDKM